MERVSWACRGWPFPLVQRRRGTPRAPVAASVNTRRRQWLLTSSPCSPSRLPQRAASRWSTPSITSIRRSRGPDPRDGAPRNFPGNRGNVPGYGPVTGRARRRVAVERGGSGAPCRTRPAGLEPATWFVVVPSPLLRFVIDDCRQRKH